ncbi:MAG: beta-ketoacyl-ACP synthase II [Candidatus Sumerlaeia bacterium]|nr:beta-ketoacyl-ACP synthase II [Candidatus Sumerlaeia bacterium]
MKRVVITGLGAITPLGNTVKEFWDGLMNSRSGAALITKFDASTHKTKFACEVKNFDPEPHITRKEARIYDPFIQYGVVAAMEAWADSGLDISKEDPAEIGVIVGSGIGGLQSVEEQVKILNESGPSRISPFLIPRMIPNMAPGMISIKLGLKGPNTCPVTACATGTHAIGDAFKVIQRGEAIAIVAGGTEGCITPLAVGGFENMRALSSRNDDPQRASRPFDKDRDGFVIGEGAGILILEEYEHAKARGAKIYAEMVGYGMTGDAFHITAPAPEGEGASRSMERALKDSKLPLSAIGYINAHGTSTELNDKNESLAIRNTFGEHAFKLAVSSTKSMTGHLLGAAGGIEAVVLAKVLETGLLPPTINYDTPDPDCNLDYVPNHARESRVEAALSNSLGFGGHNTTIIAKRV